MVPMPAPSQDTLLAALATVNDPEIHKPVTELGMVKSVAVDDAGHVTLQLYLTVAGCPLKDTLRRDSSAALARVEGVTSVEVKLDVMSDEQRAALRTQLRGGAADREIPFAKAGSLTRVYAVASGKGGVGKSSVTVNLAAAIAMRGFTVGVIDADIWGFSVPRMLGLDGNLEVSASSPTGADGTGGADAPRPRIVPNELPLGPGRLKVVSMGFLVDDEGSALMWRGLILNRAVQHFLEDVDWDGVDYLLIDMPPGTGDVQMGLAKFLPRAEMLVVTTPALTAQKVAVRVVDMGRKNFLHIAGVIENMSSYVDDTGREHHLFGTGGGQRLADEAGLPLLARIPIEAAVADGGDHGRPIALGAGPAADAFRELAAKIVDDVIPPADMSGCSTRMLDAVAAALAASDSGT